MKEQADNEKPRHQKQGRKACVDSKQQQFLDHLARMIARKHVIANARKDLK